MSIIQDALRRKDAPVPGSAPSAPAAGMAAPPQGSPPPPLPPSPPRRAPSPVLIALLAVVVLGAAGFAAHRAGLFKRPAAVPRAPDAEAPAAPPVSPAGEDPAARRVAALTGETARAEAGGPTSAVPDGATAKLATNALPPVLGTGAGLAASNASPAVAPRPAAVRWPHFVVKGVIAGGAGAGSVILNNALIDVGQSTADGIRVLRLVEDGAILEFKGEEQMFRVGSGMP